MLNYIGGVHGAWIWCFW